MSLIYLFSGFVCLVVGAELLVRSASALARFCGISPLIIGLTVVAFGTSMPEMTVSVYGTLTGHPDVALGNIIGSNTFNVLCILGIASLITPLIVRQRLIHWDVPIMIGLSLMVFACGLDGSIGRWEGLIGLSLLVVYTVFCIRYSQRESKEVVTEYSAAFAKRPTRPHISRLFLCVLFSLAGLGLMGLGAQLSVKGAVAIAETLGLSELIISLVIIGPATSLPELFTSITAAFRQENDIAVGNVVGSNIFNVLGVLGLSALVSPGGLATTPQTIYVDIPIMIAVSVACLPIFFTGHRISRWEGGLLLAGYCIYVAALLFGLKA